MEILCFAAGFVCGALIIFLCVFKKGEAALPQPEQKMPKELRAQYESLFGYDAANRED